MTDTLIQHIETVLRREFQDFGALESCQQLSAGASQETWRICFRGQSGEQRLALRRSQPTAVPGSSVGDITLDTEAELMQLAVASGIPGPKVFYVLRPEDQLGSGFIMQWLDGETLGQRINRAPELADIRPRLARQCGEILGKVHKLKLQDTALADQLPSITPAALVDQTWEYYRDLNVPVPMIDYTWRWLRDNLPANSRHTLVHGDFRNGNLMVTPTGINAVLDWELAHIGDPMRDLGWLCVNSWRFGTGELTVGGFGDVEDLLAGYQHTSGIEVDLQALRFWQVFGSFWWAMTTLQMAHTWRTGETPSLERPVIGRRSSEAQMDCVNLLIPGHHTLPADDESIALGTQLPMPAELLEGVAAFLKETVAEQLDTHNQFLARVAANSLRIAQREFQYGAGIAQQEKTRLEALLQIDDDLDTLRWMLVHQLRGSLPLNTHGLAEHLRQSVAGQLFVDQPGYSALK
ncbi:MAG: phosphotransferase family protein [Halioglobus sp.]